MFNMLLSVPMEARVWSGVGWSEGSPGQKLQDLHQKLVDLKMDMQKLNDEAGGQLLFVSTKSTCILQECSQRLYHFEAHQKYLEN